MFVYMTIIPHLHVNLVSSALKRNKIGQECAYPEQVCRDGTLWWNLTGRAWASMPECCTQSGPPATATTVSREAGADSQSSSGGGSIECVVGRGLRGAGRCVQGPGRVRGAARFAQAG